MLKYQIPLNQHVYSLNPDTPPLKKNHWMRLISGAKGHHRLLGSLPGTARPGRWRFLWEFPTSPIQGGAPLVIK